MSKTRENRLWGWLNKVKPIYKTSLHMTRVENSVGEGQPDVEGARDVPWQFEACCFMIELKCEARPADPSTKIRVKYQRSQPEWHRKRRKTKARIFVLLQIGSGNKARRYLLPSVYLDRTKKGATEAQLESWSLVTPVCSAVEVVEAVTAEDYMP